MKSFLAERAVAYCLLLFLLPCCTHLTKPTPQPVYAPCSSQDILPAITDAAIPGALKGIAKIKVKSPDESFSVKEFISAQSPHSLRLETLNPLGQPVFYAVTDGEKVFIYIPSEKKVYRGSASPETLSFFIPLSLSMDELVSIVLGRMPLIDYDDGQVSCEEGDGFYHVQLFTEDRSEKQLVKVSVENLAIVESATYEQGGSLISSMRFGDHEMIGDVLFPKRISVFIPDDETRVVISYKKLEILPDISSDEFRLTAPKGVEVVPLK